MKWVFWAAAIVIAYTYLGYPLWLCLRARWRPRRVQRAPQLPFVSVVLVVRNESETIAAKLRNLLELNYPADRSEIVAVSDGSVDGTDELLREKAVNSRLRIVLSPTVRGKAACLNSAMHVAQGEILLFTDARQKIEPDAVRFLVENFADASVGCVSGELMLGDAGGGERLDGVGLYWRIERAIREMESRAGSVVGATGALYAVRRVLLAPLPPDTILDDLYIPMTVARRGSRVLLDSRARAWDVVQHGGDEFRRKVRTLSGNYQLLQLAPWLLSKANPIRFEFISHKLLRLLVPFALAAALVSSAVMPGPVYRIAFIIQIVFYALSLLATMRLRRGPLARVADAALTFVLLNAAALVAFANFVTGRKVAWGR